MDKAFVIKLDQVGIGDVNQVGGKNASLGEMLRSLAPKGVNIPGGYAVTAYAYKYFLESTGLDKFISDTLAGLNISDLESLSSVAKLIREKIVATPFPADLNNALVEAHKREEQVYGAGADFAVRSSATAEDLPDASFAGEHESYLNISGTDNILLAIKKAMASLFTDRAISYRVDKGFDHSKVLLSVGVQKMVRSDKACSGIMFTLDTESGFPGVIVISASWGLGEMIVQGKVTPDEFLVFKNNLQNKNLSPIIDKKLGDKIVKMVYTQAAPFTKVVDTSQGEREQFVLNDEEILTLASWGTQIEKHYSDLRGKWVPMDTEWAKDGLDGKLYIVQARPETVHSQKDFSKIQEYMMLEDGEVMVKGAAVGYKIATGKSRVILDIKDISLFQEGEVLITEITDPDWEPIMKIAAAIITDKGGRTSHAAIVARELGIPAVVGAGDATTKVKTGDVVTVDTTGSEGRVLRGELKFKIEEHDVKTIPQTKTHIMVNIATPNMAFDKSFLPNQGVGLAREEFIIASEIGIHPMALINFDSLVGDVKAKIAKKTAGYTDKKAYYVDNLAYGIAKIAAAFNPKPVILRFSDFKTNEYRMLLGGDLYEPEEENPMIGWRGASRYYSDKFVDAFVLEVQAVKKVREQMGLDNLIVMIPFCRTVDEGKKVIKVMEDHGLVRGQNGLKVYVMCEIPSNVILAEEFLEVFDGMSIGSNDLTQLLLGIDRDGNALIRDITNENDKAVKTQIAKVIKICKEKGKYIGICGQAPSDYEDFAKFLVEEGIESISLNPDAVIKTTLRISEVEKNHANSGR